MLFRKSVSRKLRCRSSAPGPVGTVGHGVCFLSIRGCTSSKFETLGTHTVIVRRFRPVDGVSVSKRDGIAGFWRAMVTVCVVTPLLLSVGIPWGGIAVKLLGRWLPLLLKNAYAHDAGGCFILEGSAIPLAVPLCPRFPLPVWAAELRCE